MKLFIVLSLVAGAFSAAIDSRGPVTSPNPNQVLTGRGLDGDWTCVSNGMMPHSYCCQQVAAMNMIFYNCGTRLKMPFCIGSKTLKRVCCDKIIDTSKDIVSFPGVDPSVKIKNMAGRCQIV